MSIKGQHVVPNGSKWSVRGTGAARASGTFATRQEAISKAKDLARAQQTELYIHGADGRIRERDSYSREPAPAKG
jgi:LPS sulfotransferase NodH